MNQQQIDQLRHRLQAADSEAKKKRLEEEFGAIEIHSSGFLPPEVELEWYDYFCRFEAYFEEVEMVNVWERLGRPEIQLLGDLDPAVLQATFEQLIELIEHHQIMIVFLGDWELPDAYRFITEELIYEEIEEKPFGDYISVFNATTPAYDIQFWIEHLIFCLVNRDRRGTLASFSLEKLCDVDDQPVSETTINRSLENLWEKLPEAVDFELGAPTIDISDGQAAAVATIRWTLENEKISSTSSFQLIRDPNESSFWDITQTSLLDDLAKVVEVKSSP